MWQISSGYELFYSESQEYLSLAIINGKREQAKILSMMETITFWSIFCTFKCPNLFQN